MDFSLDSKAYKFLEKVYKIIQLNYLVIVGSLGIITIGASFSAAAYVTRKWIEQKEVEVFKEFKKSYIENFKKSLVLSLIFIIVIVLVTLGKSLASIYLIVQLYVYLLSFIAFYISGNYHMSLKQTIVTSFKLLNSYIWIIIPFMGIVFVLKFIFLKSFMLFLMGGIGLILLSINTLIYYLFKSRNIV